MLGSLSVLPQAISYYDGFFVSPTQVLARATTSGGKGVTTEFKEGQKLDAYTVFEDISKVTPDVERELTISGGFLNNLASTSDPKAFTYVFDGNEFPYVPLLQPRLGSIEEWKFLNNNNDEHPIHIHVNDFQVTLYLDPTRGIETGPEMWAVDNANVPAPVHGRRGVGHPAGCAQFAHEVRRFHRPLRDALPSPQPRGQRADDDGQRHPRRVDLCGGRSRIEGEAGAGEDLRRQRRQASRHGHALRGLRGDAERGHGRCQRRRRLRSRGRRRQGPRSGGRCLFGQGRRRQICVRDRACPLRGVRTRPRAAASAWRLRRSTDRPPTTSSSAPALACRAKSRCSAPICRRSPARRRRCSRPSPPIPTTAPA